MPLLIQREGEKDKDRKSGDRPFAFSHFNPREKGFVSNDHRLVGLAYPSNPPVGLDDYAGSQAKAILSDVLRNAGKPHSAPDQPWQATLQTQRKTLPTSNSSR